MIKSKKGLTAVEIVVIIAIIAIIAAIIIPIIGSILNEQNRITEGVIIDKSYTAEKVITKYKTAGDIKIPYTSKESAHCYFQLEGEKDEVMVRYWLEVSEQDYNSYRIGDYYRL